MNLLWINIVLIVIGLVNALNLTSNGQHSEIANLKQEFKDLTRNLTAALNFIQAEFQKLNSKLDKSQTVAFSACLGSSGRIFGPHQSIEFDSVILNEGRAYDPRHGIFRAPVGGIYHFAVSFLSSPPGDSWIEIVRDGQQLVYTFAAGDSHNVGSTEVNVRLEAGQDVWCRNAFTDRTIPLHSYGKYSCFSVDGSCTSIGKQPVAFSACLGSTGPPTCKTARSHNSSS